MASAAGETRPIFDGRTLDGWEGTAGRWTVEDEALTGTIAAGETLATNAFLYWQGEAADFDLRFEYRITGGPSVNSGVQIRTLNDPAGTELLEKNWGRFNDTPAATRGTITRIKTTFGEAPLWAYEGAHGRAVFDRVCGTCHALGGSSAGQLGPDLAGTWRNGADYFIENIVDPNAVIGDAFQLTIVTLKDGTVVSGAVEAESATSLTLRTLTGPVVSVSAADVASRQKLEQSLMPPGLLEALPERDMIALLKFLTTGP